MQIFREISELPTEKNSVLTLGTFDGIHLGHQEIISKVLEISKEKNLRDMVITFFPHPRNVLSNRDNVKVLSTLDEKIELFEKIGINNLFVIKFSDQFSKLTPKEFLEVYLVKSVGLSEIVIGYDHHFGKGREGDSEFLMEASNQFNFNVTKVEPFNVDGVSVSSTKIRNALDEGDVVTSEKMLGRYFAFSGTVVPGDKRGRELGYPTANIKLDYEHKLLPAIGIYAVLASLNGNDIPALLSIGKRPTFYESGEIVPEVHLLDFNREIYGEKITVKMVERLRGEEKFESAEELIEQMHKDKIEGEKILKKLVN